MPAWVASVDLALAARPAVRAAMDRGDAYGSYVCTGLPFCYIATLLPIRDSTGRVAAYLAAYAEQAGYAARRGGTLWVFALGSLAILAAGWALRRWLASRQRLHTIGENMGEGLYVIDREGKALHVNRAACELLGYGRRELLGRDAHRLFHLDETGGEPGQARCPIRLASQEGRVYTSENESARTSRSGAATAPCCGSA